MKIGFISEAYPPMSGGVATSAQRLARELVKIGHEVVVLTYDNLKPLVVDDFYLEENDFGVHVYRVGPFFLKNKSVDVEILSDKVKAILRRRAFSQMKTILKNENVDIILTFYVINSGFIGQLLANDLNLPCVAGIRGNDVGRNIFQEQRFTMLKWTLDEATHIVSVNQHLQDRAKIAFREISDKIQVIHNGFDMNRVSETTPDLTSERTNLGWDKDDLVITFIGILREKKGISTLLHALEKINKDSIKVRLLVVGPSISGMEKYMLNDLWNELVEKNIIKCTGLLDRDDVFKHAMNADVVCLPSLDDGMPNGLIEGMALGLCPVTTDILSDILTDGEDGITVECGNVEQLVHTLDELNSNREFIEKYGKEAKKTIINRFTPRREALAYETLFNEILSIEE